MFKLNENNIFGIFRIGEHSLDKIENEYLCNIWNEECENYENYPLFHSTNDKEAIEEFKNLVKLCERIV